MKSSSYNALGILDFSLAQECQTDWRFSQRWKALLAAASTWGRTLLRLCLLTQSGQALASPTTQIFLSGFGPHGTLSPRIHTYTYKIPRFALLGKRFGELEPFSRVPPADVSPVSKGQTPLLVLCRASLGLDLIWPSLQFLVRESVLCPVHAVLLLKTFSWIRPWKNKMCFEVIFKKA